MLVSSLIVVAACYGLGLMRLWRRAGIGKGISRGQALAFAAGWVALVAALVGPLHELSEQLLSAHMVQHELLMVVAAPLFATSSPAVALAWLWPRTASKTFHVVHAVTAPAVVWLLHAAALWIWHMPALYQAAVENEQIHALQHTCFFVSACLFWWGIGHGRYGRLGGGAAVIYVFTTAMHSGALGALLTFAPSLWYPIYASTTAAFGLTPLEDQQLAGLIMWIPAGVVFTGVGLAFLAGWIRESERRVRTV